MIIRCGYMKSNLPLIFFALLLVLVPITSFATAYAPLVGIPGLEDGGGNMEAYLNTLYAISISLAALLAVIKIIIAGVKYMLSDIVTTKGQAIKDIQGSLLGLIVVVMAWVILYVINPNILSTQIFLVNLETPPPPPPTVAQTVLELNEDIVAAGGIPAINGGTLAGYFSDDTERFESDCSLVGGRVVAGIMCSFDLTGCDLNETGLCCNATRDRRDNEYDEGFSYCKIRGQSYRTIVCNRRDDRDCIDARATCERTGTVVASKNSAILCLD